MISCCNQNEKTFEIRNLQFSFDSTEQSEQGGGYEQRIAEEPRADTKKALEN
jgi:hypothetical protein